MKNVILTIAGEQFEGKLGMGFIETTLENEGIKDGDITGVSSIKQIYYSIKFAKELKGEVFMSRYDFYDKYIDDLTAEEMLELTNTFSYAFLRSSEKKMNFKTDAEKRAYEKAMKDLEKKIQPPIEKVAKKQI